ncbi:MAG: hypothetical protein QM820_47840 [Minicystis sp.]
MQPQPPLPPRPGLVKIRAVPLVTRRHVELVAAASGPLRDVVEGADVVSEGRTQIEGGRLVYYGSTSVLLLRESAGGSLPDAEIDGLATVLRRDPHVRLLVLRIAHREAAARAGGPIGTVHAEIDVAPCARGVALLVEVVARLSRGDLRSTRGPVEDAAAAGSEAHPKGAAASEPR